MQILYHFESTQTSEGQVNLALTYLDYEVVCVKSTLNSKLRGGAMSWAKKFLSYLLSLLRFLRNRVLRILYGLNQHLSVDISSFL